MSATPKEYLANLKNGVITDKMLSDVLYSFNKRAKNKRDKLREMKHVRYYSWKLDKSIEKYEADMESLYAKKSDILSFFKPVCIHKQDVGNRIRVYDYESDFKKLYKEKDVIWENCYFDKEELREVWFFDYIEYGRKFLWFKYYILDDKSFHQPINESDIKDNNDIEIIDIDRDFSTEGKDINELLSLQFCNKVYDLFVNHHDEIVYDNN